MANTTLFSSKNGNSKKVAPKANTTNEAGGKAYSTSSEHALAQYACTAMFENQFYASAEDQFDTILKLAQEVSPEFLAKLAIYSRTQGHMKDVPALLLAVLATRDITLFKAVFNRVIDNGRMLRNFVQIIRSGKVGRKSLGTAPKRMVENWLAGRTPEQIFRDSVGNDPSLADVIKLCHPKAETVAKNATYQYVLGKAYNKRNLPKVIKDFEKFKKTDPGKRVVPDVDFRLLSSLNLSEAEWTEIAKNAKWQMTRMNLNTFERHGVFKDKEMVKLIADRLRDEAEVSRSKCFPYQLYVAYKNTQGLPTPITEALQDAADIALANVPELTGTVHVTVDISGSMSAAVGRGRNAKTGGVSITCSEAASVFAAALVRKAEDPKVYQFNTKCIPRHINRRDSLMTIVKQLSEYNGGTDCGVTLKYLNDTNATGDTVVILSDMQSWYEGAHDMYMAGATSVSREWKRYKARNPNAKLVCVNLASCETVQAPSDKSVLNVGGFSDQVFEVIKAHQTGSGNADFWAKHIDKTVKIALD